MKKWISLIFVSLIISVFTFAGNHYSTLNCHSHNDYDQENPFYEAYNCHFGSIEADIWAIDGKLLVAHHEKEIIPENTIETMYIDPIVTIFKENNGKAWKDISGTFQLLIDLKTPTEPTLTLLVDIVKQYPDVFNPEVNENAVRIVITGNTPKPEDFKNYPEFIYFDGKFSVQYNDEQRARLALYSDTMGNYTDWKKTGRLTLKEKKGLKKVIKYVHDRNIKIRFWSAPDYPEAWDVIMKLGIDYINTDHIQELANYINNLEMKK